MECGKLMGYIADHDTGNALSLVDRFYAEGKDMGALLDEMACLTRDFMILKTAPREGISMLSGVASDEEVKALAAKFSTGELARMMEIIQQTAAGFTRSTSRRMDAELCVVKLCQPELSLDADSVNSRITRLEEMIKGGSFQMAPMQQSDEEEERPPVPDDMDAPPEYAEPVRESIRNQAPNGFWVDMVSEIRSELKPPASAFFVTTPNAPVEGILRGNQLELVCTAGFIVDVLSKPEILEMISRKASAKLGRPVRAVAIDRTTMNTKSGQMEKLIRFGQEHADIVNIK